MDGNGINLVYETVNVAQERKMIKTTSRGTLVSRNVSVGSHRTSVRLEPDMWSGLREICRREHVTMHDIASAVAVRKDPDTSLTAALRVFVMAYFRAAATEEGHSRAGHGPGGAFFEGLLRKKTEDQDNRISPFDSAFRTRRL